MWGDPAILRQKMEILDAHCADIKRDPKEIQRSAVALLFMSEDNAFLEQMRNTDLQQPAIIGTLVKHTSANAVALDPLGLEAENPADAWFEIMRTIAADLHRCLTSK